MPRSGVPAKPDLTLVPAQRRALDHVTAVAARRRAQAVRAITAEVGGSVTVDGLVDAVRLHGRVTLNFHPDRLLANGTTVAEGLARDGQYRSQFETRISNGGRTAFPGGDRDVWEQRLFGGAYQAEEVAGAHRPRYGSLNLANHPDGGSPRFGSCHLRLRRAVAERCTFTVGDSHLGPTDVGTLAAFECVLSGLLGRFRETAVCVGVTGVHPVDLLRSLPRPRPVEPGRALDDYVEAQVHGGVDLRTDVEAMVLDPSFRGTTSGGLLIRAARRWGVPVEWHGGFELAADEFGPEFRGPHVPPLARAVATTFEERRGVIDAALIGRAARSFREDPARWSPFGPDEELLQSAKHLWHTLVQFGRARQDPTDRSVFRVSSEN